MVRLFLFAAFLFSSGLCLGQEFKVEFDPSNDLSHYKTFSFGETEIITIKDQRKVADSVLHEMIRSAIKEDLTRKGLVWSSGRGDLVISYVTGTSKMTDAGKIGPLGHTPGSNLDETSYQHDYRQGSLYIDVNDPASNKLVWHIAAVVNAPNPDSREFFSQIVQRGFRKFSLKPKRTKKKV